MLLSLFLWAGSYSSVVSGSSSGMYSKVSLYPLRFKRLSKYGADFKKIFLFDEFVDILLDIERGICFVMEGGWLDSLCMYNGSLFGLMKVLYDSFSRLRVKSK